MPGEAIVRAGDMARELAFLAKVRAKSTISHHVALMCMPGSNLHST